MNKTLTLIPLAAILLFAACSSDSATDVQTDGDTAFPIRLQLSLDDQQATRARQSTVLAKGDIVYAWSDYYSDNTEWFGAWKLIADSVNGLAGEGTRFFPKGGQRVNFYAVHGKKDFADDEAFPANGYVHTVSKDQVPDTAYLTSDLIYGSRYEVPRQTTTVRIPMYHMLSKVQVLVKSASADLPDAYLQQASVHLVDVQRSVTFTPAKINEDSLANFNSRGHMLSLVNGSTDSVRLSTVVVPRGRSGWVVRNAEGDCVIPPQKLKTFVIQMPNSGNFRNMVLVADVDKVLQSGYKYTFHITVSPATLKAGVIEVVDWDSETSDDEFENRSFNPGTVTATEWGDEEERGIGLQ